MVAVVSAGVTLGGRYKLVERIAGGGMGDVWRGTDDVLGRTVAVKILLPALLEEPGFAERFRGEARTMATINHPGVVDVYDYGSDATVGAYLVMEYVEGDALSRTLGRVGRLTPARTMALVAQAADALQAAHDKGIVHRDVKPGNLLVRPNGTLVLTDFGIARSAMVGQLTAAGSVLGTASYISPEQAAGATATPLSDIYALGVVAYQCLSGRRPFEGDNPLEIAMKHVRDQPPPLPPDAPPQVRSIVDRAMAKDPAARFPTAAALGQVARRAAAVLSTGNTTLGPSGAPVSVPPLPQSTSPGPMGTPGPVSPGPMPPVTRNQPPGVARPPVAPGGTRVMQPNVPVSPGVLAAGQVPTGPHGQAPVGPRGTVPPGGMPMAPPPPGVSRGSAAAPPPPPPRADTSYYPMATPTPGPARPSGGRGGPILIGVLVGILVLLLVAAVAWALTRKTGGTGGAGTGGQVTTGTLKDVGCGRLRGRSATFARQQLQQAGFTVLEVPVNGGQQGQVKDVQPCRAATGAQITLTVATGHGGGNGGGGGNGSGGNSGPGSGGGTGPVTPTAPGPTATCDPLVNLDCILPSG